MLGAIRPTMVGRHSSWVIAYSGIRYVMQSLLVCLLTYHHIACYLWRTIVVFTFDPVWSTDQVTNLELSFLTTTVVTNIFCTVAIIYRIVGVSGWRRSLKTYHNLMEILIESSIMYTVVYAIRIGMQIHSHYFTEELDERALFAKALGASITVCTFTIALCFDS